MEQPTLTHSNLFKTPRSLRTRGDLVRTTTGNEKAWSSSRQRLVSLYLASTGWYGSLALLRKTGAISASLSSLRSVAGALTFAST